MGLETAQGGEDRLEALHGGREGRARDDGARGGDAALDVGRDALERGGERGREGHSALGAAARRAAGHGGLLLLLLGGGEQARGGEQGAHGRPGGGGRQGARLGARELAAVRRDDLERRVQLRQKPLSPRFFFHVAETPTHRKKRKDRRKKKSGKKRKKKKATVSHKK